MNKKLTIINMILAIALQIIIAINGLIVPRLILEYFGSETNGLVASINQFLSFIQLLEGGLSGVIMAALYKALAEKNDERISSILKAANTFFRKIALIYICYSIIVAIIYPLFNNIEMSYGSVLSLVLILAVGTFVQYFFSLTYRILINADRRGYIVSISQIVSIIVNFVLVVVSLKIYPEIHFLKGICSIAFFINPIVFHLYVKRNYKIKKEVEPDKTALSQRWAGFGQNLAYFIHTNTDIVILTIATDLKTVSIYSVYLMVANSLKSLIVAISGAFSPSFGNVLVTNDENNINRVFNLYEFSLGTITTFTFACCLCLILPFVSVYTSGINDVNYIQTEFAILLVLGEAVYCLREPYVAAAYAAGHFKKTAIFSYIEAALNIIISMALVWKFGLIGVAIGTLVSMSIRYILHVIYLTKNIMNRSLLKAIPTFLVFSITMVVSYLICGNYNFIIVDSYLTWFLYALMCAITVLIVLVSLIVIFQFKQLKNTIKVLFKK